MIRISVERKKQNLTQSELAEKVRVSQQMVARWESGKSFPRTSRLIQIAAIFGCTVDDLLREEKTKK